MRVGTRVKIKAPAHRARPLTGLDRDFEGRLGTVVANEGGLNRVRLDRPVVLIEGGEVEDDLWSNEFLRRTRR